MIIWFSCFTDIDISTGSPAERANLLVGDEIVEVNGKSLEDASHGEVIAYIHKVTDLLKF